MPPDVDVHKSYLGKERGWKWIVWCRSCGFERSTGWKGGHAIAQAVKRGHICERAEKPGATRPVEPSESTSMDADTRRRVCSDCGTTVGEWWWFCEAHDVWECDGCSYPGEGSKSYDEGTHRFFCTTSVGIHVDRSGVEDEWCGHIDGESDAS